MKRIASSTLEQINRPIGVTEEFSGAQMHGISHETAQSCGGLPNSPANPCPVFGTAAAPDPLSYMTAPPLPAQNWGSVTTSGTMTLSPGTYSSLTIGSNSVVTMQPGLYYFNGSGGLQFNGAATLIGSGVMFYFTGSATINAVGGGNQVSNIQLTAMTTAQSVQYTGSAEYAGILMYQDPLDTNTGPGPNQGPTLGGTDNSFFSGALYFPKDQLMFFGNNTTTGISVGIVVADAVALSGHPILGTGGLPPGVNLIKNAVLVE